MVLEFLSYTGGGPTPKFSPYHVWKAYDAISTQGPVGRKTLSQILGIGEGSTRTILNKMVRKGTVENTKKGAILTERGWRQFRNSGISVAPLQIGDLTIGSRDCAVLVKGLADRINTGYEQRDEAVRAGAIGATTLIFRDGKLMFPDDPEVPEQSKFLPIRALFALEDNDVVIIGTAQSYEAAEKGAVTAALALSDSTRPCWQDGTSGLISPDAEAEELKCLALAVHELVGRMPVTMRSRNNNGVRCEDGKVVDINYTGPVLEESLRRNTIIRRIAPSGHYRGVPVVVVPIVRRKEAVAVFGIVDITRGRMFELISRTRKENL